MTRDQLEQMKMKGPDGLVKLAQQHDIPGRTKMRKPELVAALDAKLNPPAAEPEPDVVVIDVQRDTVPPVTALTAIAAMTGGMTMTPPIPGNSFRGTPASKALNERRRKDKRKKKKLRKQKLKSRKRNRAA